VVADKITLAPGSQGNAANGGVSGLTATETYLVRKVTDNKWRAVTAAGAAKEERASLDLAIPDKESLGAGVTAITGLTNGVEYEVYLYQAPANGGQPAVDNKKNIIDISALTAAQSITLKKAASGAGGSVIIYTGDPNVAAVAKADSAAQEFGKTAKKYTLTSTTPAGAKVEAKLGEKYATFDLTASTDNSLSIVITVGTVAPAPTTTELAVGSHGTEADEKITGLIATKSYVVHNETDNTWHVVKADGTLDTDEDSLADAIGATPLPALNAGITEITGLTNGDTYNVAIYVAADDGDSVPASDKNGIIDIKDLGDGEDVTITATTAPTGGTMVYTGVPNDIVFPLVPPTSIAAQTFGSSTPGQKNYALSATTGTGAIVALADDPFVGFILSGVPFSTTITVGTAVP
jgi:hypothetical protein